MNGLNAPNLPARKTSSDHSNAYPGSSTSQQPLPQQYQPQQYQQQQQQYAPPPPIQQPSFQPPQPLPQGWLSQWDPSSQRPFFVYTPTGLTQWNDPRMPAQYAPPPISPSMSMQMYAPVAPAPQQHQHAPIHGQQYPLGAPVAAPPINHQMSPANLSIQQAAPLQQPPSVNSSTVGQQVIANPAKVAFVPAQQVSSIGTELAYNAPAPAMGLTETVDPTVAIALELKQSIPSLRKGPVSDAKQPIKDAYRNYLREIQDCQNTHTRAIRDAQVTHQKQVQDADYYSKHQMQNQASNGFSSLQYGGSGSLFSAATSLFNKGTQYSQQRDTYNKRLSDAKTTYERTVEHSAQRLNDAVESANRRYDDVIYELSKNQ